MEYLVEPTKYYGMYLYGELDRRTKKMGVKLLRVLMIVSNIILAKSIKIAVTLQEYSACLMSCR